MFKLVVVKRRSSSVPVVTDFDLETLQKMLETMTLTAILKKYSKNITKAQLSDRRFTCS